MTPSQAGGVVILLLAAIAVFAVLVRFEGAAAAWYVVRLLAGAAAFAFVVAYGVELVTR